jgi:hypothetical protein
MRYVKAEPASGDVYIWSLAPASVLPGYHKILRTVKETKVAAASFTFDLARGSGCAIISRLTKNKTFSLPRALVLNHRRERLRVDIADVAADIDTFEGPCLLSQAVRSLLLFHPQHPIADDNRVVGLDRQCLSVRSTGTTIKL